MKRHICGIILIGVLVIASVIRLWSITNVPLSPDWDEVALGYNAYSILETGRDEYGEFLPLTLRSFGDYKPGLYAYFIIPFITIFDLNVLAVRLPSALFGILGVYGLYLLVQELFSKSFVINGIRVKREWLGILSAFLLAISPWHIQFSRVAFEANVAVTLNLFSTLFFIKGLKKPYYLLIAAALMGMNLYVYQSQKVFTPLLLLLLVFIFRKQIFSVSRKFLTGACIVGLIIALPFITSILFDSGSLSRAQSVSFLSDKTPLLEENTKRIIDDRNRGDIVGLVLDNRRLVYVNTFTAGYLSHFDPNWLFITGDFENNRHHAPNMGLLYISLLPFLLLGVYRLVFATNEEGVSDATKLLLFFWILLVPLPAAITQDVPHAVRTLQMAPILQVLTAYGLLVGFVWVKTMKYKILKAVFYAGFSVVFILNFVYYLNQYFVQMNYSYARDWQYGYKEIVAYVKPMQKNYEKIIVSNKGDMDQSHMFFLFYLKYDPQQYLMSGGTKPGNGNLFGNFEFRPFQYYEENSPNTLLIGSPADFPEEPNLVHSIHYPNSEEAIKIVEKDYQ